jgi:hypothetical protein
MNIILLFITIFAVAALATTLFISRLFYARFVDLEQFVLNLNKVLGDFDRDINSIIHSHILVYDETVFSVVQRCQDVQKSLNEFLKKYDEYSDYIYTRDVEQEKPEVKEYLGTLINSPNRR